MLPSKKTFTLRQKTIAAIAALATLVPTLLIFNLKVASAAPTVAYVRFDRMATGAAISGTACLNTDASGTEAKVQLTFPTGWTISTTAADWTTSTSNLPSGATAWVTIGATATTATGQVVTFSSGNLSTATLYCFNFAGASSTLGTAGTDKVGSMITLTSGDVAIDTINWATAVTASVPTTFSFALSGATIALGTLSTSTTTSGNVTATISTNARNGWLSWLKHTGLSSATTGTSIAVPGAYPTISDLASTTGFVVDVDATTGSPTIDAGFDGTNSTSGGNPTTTFLPIATKNAAASGNVITINARAKVAGTQAAATDYTDTLTIVAAGNF